MGRNSKINKEERIKACRDYISGKKSIIDLSIELKISKTAIRHWIKLYEQYGEIIFEEKARNKSYAIDFKLQVIKEYLSGKGSFRDLAVKYNISDHMVYSWVKIYNSGIEIKEYNPKGDVYTMKSRKTTIDEKLQIIEYVLKNNYDYKGAASKYSVPYANVYSWVKKYEKSKESGLKDKRGRPTLINIQPKELTEIEKLQMELEKEKLKNERLERAIIALKKNEMIRNLLKSTSRKLDK